MSYLFIYFIFLHWLADFVCQTDWMATNKSSNIKALLAHIITYTSVLLIGIILLTEFYSIPLSTIAKFIFINIFTHFIIDFITSKITSTLYKANDIHNFFIIIGLDQFAHIAILFASYNYFIGF